MRCGHRFFCNSHVWCFLFLLGGGPDLLCNFYEINSSQEFFCIANILVLMVLFSETNQQSANWVHCKRRGSEELISCGVDVVSCAYSLGIPVRDPLS